MTEGEFMEEARYLLARPALATPEVLPLCRAFYREYPTGGSLHIVLDDGNVKDGHVDACIRYAEEERDEPGAALGRLLRRLSVTQRLKLYHSLNVAEEATC